MEQTRTLIRPIQRDEVVLNRHSIGHTQYTLYSVHNMANIIFMNKKIKNIIL